MYFSVQLSVAGRGHCLSVTVSDTMCENSVQLQWINNCLTAPTMAETVTRPSLSSFSAGRGISSKCFSRVMIWIRCFVLNVCILNASLASETYSPIYLVKCETLHLEFPICSDSFSSPLPRVWLHARSQSECRAVRRLNYLQYSKNSKCQQTLLEMITKRAETMKWNYWSALAFLFCSNWPKNTVHKH